MIEDLPKFAISLTHAFFSMTSVDMLGFITRTKHNIVSLLNKTLFHLSNLQRACTEVHLTRVCRLKLIWRTNKDDDIATLTLSDDVLQFRQKCVVCDFVVLSQLVL